MQALTEETASSPQNPVIMKLTSSANLDLAQDIILYHEDLVHIPQKMD